MAAVLRCPFDAVYQIDALGVTMYPDAHVYLGLGFRLTKLVNLLARFVASLEKHIS